LSGHTGGGAGPSGADGFPPIADYAVIGDSRTAALVSRDGSIDWLCLPRFDSPSVFAALLDRRRGGRFRVGPTAAAQVARRYVGDTNVLETSFTTAAGRVRLVDLMPVTDEERKGREPWPGHHVLRMVECLEGEVEVEVSCDPRPEYGRCSPGIIDRGPFGFRFEDRRQGLILRSDVPVAPAPGGPGLHGRERLRAGDIRWVSLLHEPEEPAIVPPHGEDARRRVELTLRWWEEWAGQCRYGGPFREHVVRSALTLKLLTYAPSGAVIAAPTTSLPEQPGGVRNWDYRYCWLRDASLTLRAFLELGLRAEGEAFFAWLLHSTRLSRPELQIFYTVHGETRVPEHELTHLDGYAGSRPVRVGNSASEQLQLDTYGEVLDSALRYVRAGGSLDRSSRKLLRQLGSVVVRRWREPDEGIWEVQNGPRQHTHSKVMAWVALDRLLKLHELGRVELEPAPLEAERSAIRAEVEARGYNERIGAYTHVLDGHELDASLLLLPIYGYSDAGEPRTRSTCERIFEQLGRGGGLLCRYTYDDGLPPGEGAFGIAGFWGVECRARMGQIERAEAELAELCSRSNDVGLFGEEIDPETGAALGNYPQAFTHVGLICAAKTLEALSGSAETRARSPGEGPR
jgi:GH15 family glucan-1,4-alpha-glucosidase